jgi:hypothetical protein
LKEFARHVLGVISITALGHHVVDGLFVPGKHVFAIIF